MEAAQSQTNAGTGHGARTDTVACSVSVRISLLFAFVVSDDLINGMSKPNPQS